VVETTKTRMSSCTLRLWTTGNWHYLLVFILFTTDASRRLKSNFLVVNLLGQVNWKTGNVSNLSVASGSFKPERNTGLTISQKETLMQ